MTTTTKAPPITKPAYIAAARDLTAADFTETAKDPRKITRVHEAAMRYLTAHPPAAGVPFVGAYLDAMDAVRAAVTRFVYRGDKIVIGVAIDKYAMKTATAHFVEMGFKVDDVHATHPVDLICGKGDEVAHVEVKGTRTLGEEVLVTSGEVAYARRHAGQMTLFLVHSIDVNDERGDVYASGGQVEIYDWAVEESRLRPKVYAYRVKGGQPECTRKRV